jgi:lipooligosaccharide transport system permease protein
MTAIAIPRTARRAIQRPDVSWLALRVWQRNRDVYLNVWKSELIWPLVEPLLTLIALGIGLGDFVEIEGQDSYIDYIAPGMLAVFPMWTAVSECAWGSFFRMDAQRTFDAMVATPVSVDDVTTGEVLWAASRSLLTTVYMMAMIVVFGAVSSPLVLAVFPLAVFTGVMFGAISLCYTAVARSVSSLNYFFAAFVTPQFWLAGVFFPLTEMPKWVETAAWFTPAYHVVSVYRGLAAGEWAWSYAGHIAWIGVVLVAFYALALFLMRRRLVK